VLNHSVCKTLAFFAIGRLGQMYGTHDLGQMAGSLRRAPLWGAGFFGAVLVLIGVAPFAIFMSEFQILRAAASARATVTLAIFLAATGVVFVAALKHVIGPAWGREVVEPKVSRPGVSGAVLVVGGLALLLLLGVWLPEPLRAVLADAASIVGGRP
jgi:hydrogenase-4 component F